MISPLASIHPNAKLGNDVVIEPFALCQPFRIEFFFPFFIGKAGATDMPFDVLHFRQIQKINASCVRESFLRPGRKDNCKGGPFAVNAGGVDDAAVVLYYLLTNRKTYS